MRDALAGVLGVAVKSQGLGTVEGDRGPDLLVELGVGTLEGSLLRVGGLLGGRLGPYKQRNPSVSRFHIACRPALAISITILSRGSLNPGFSPKFVFSIANSCSTCRTGRGRQFTLCCSFRRRHFEGRVCRKGACGGAGWLLSGRSFGRFRVRNCPSSSEGGRFVGDWCGGI